MKSEVEVPEGWGIKNVNDLFHVKNGTTPSTKKMSYWKNGSINWFTPADLSKLKGKKHVIKSKRKIAKDALDKCNLTLMPQNSLIISCRAPVGYIAILDEKSTFNQGCKGLIGKTSLVDYTYYLYYLLYSKKRLQAISGGSTFKELSKSAFLKFIVPYPPFKEQQKIADILSKVDEQIDFTEKIIDKTEKLKKGLMQKLLTKGIEHTQFKKTELGMIPKEWEIIKTEKQIELSTGFAFKSSEYSENNIDYKLLRGANITRGKLRWKKEITKFWKYTPDFEKFLLEENDIVIGMDGSLVGRNSAIITKKDLPLLLVQRVARLKTKEGLNPKYLFYHIDNGRFIKYVDTVKTNTGIPHISGKNIQNYKITFPPIWEQNRIASILSKVDEHIQDNKKELKHLKELKKGLMQDLLTGKVRVSV